VEKRKVTQNSPLVVEEKWTSIHDYTFVLIIITAMQTVLNMQLIIKAWQADHRLSQTSGFW